MPKFFELACGTKRVPTLDFPWPYSIAVCFEDIEHPIAFNEGVGFGAAGSEVSIENALSPEWSDHFEITKGQWLVPFLENRLKGHQFPREAMFEKYEFIFGQPPASYDL